MKKRVKIAIIAIIAIGFISGGIVYLGKKEVNAVAITKSQKQEKEGQAVQDNDQTKAQANNEAEAKKQVQQENKVKEKQIQKEENSKSVSLKQQSKYIDSVLPVEQDNRNYKSPNKIMTVIKNTPVYAKADESSSKVGSVEYSERVIWKGTNGNYTKINYSNSQGMKEGYVSTNDLEVAPIIPNNFNDLVVPSNVTKVQYGTSGLGRALYYYKIGNGKKTILMNFQIHGYEDSWVQDGYVLTQIGEYLIKNLSEREAKNGNLNGWTFYIIPSANPDGLLNGYTNNGPGRAQVSDKIDMNRDFSGPKFVPSSSPRNKTQEEPFTAPETVALAKLVKKLASENSDFIVTDTHGWLDFTKGNASVASYFDSAFGLKNQVIHKYFGGYLVGYAKMKGAKEVLIELPNPSSPANAKKEKYNQKMLLAVNNLIDNYKF
ncbi:MAG: M14 family zinc carboxypeptidase [Sarcina sp.]